MTNKIDAKTSTILQQGARSMDVDSSEAYERLYLEIHALERLARETFQYQFRKDYQAVVEKLQNGDSLSPDDKHLLAQLVIADAKSYVKHAKEFETWKDQINRMLLELKEVQGQGVQTADDLLHIQAICRDLRSVLPDLTFYLRERERIQSYEKNDIGSLRPELKKLLAEVIDVMMKSGKL